VNLPAYIKQLQFALDQQTLFASLAFILAELNTTIEAVAKKPIMLITTKSSIKVNPFLGKPFNFLSEILFKCFRNILTLIITLFYEKIFFSQN